MEKIEYIKLLIEALKGNLFTAAEDYSFER